MSDKTGFQVVLPKVTTKAQADQICNSNIRSLIDPYVEIIQEAIDKRWMGGTLDVDLKVQAVSEQVFETLLVLYRAAGWSAGPVMISHDDQRDGKYTTQGIRLQ